MSQGAAPETSASSRDLIVRAARSMIGLYSYDPKGKRGSGYLDDKVMDCSEFVYQAYLQAGFGKFPVLNSHGIASASDFTAVKDPLPGDIVYWSHGHVAIVEDPATGEFIGSQSSTGPARSNYKTNVYWKARLGRKFFRWNLLP